MPGGTGRKDIATSVYHCGVVKRTGRLMAFLVHRGRSDMFTESLAHPLILGRPPVEPFS